jgi:hypothetical protein
MSPSPTLSPAAWRSLVSRVDEVLHQDWDPIGVRGFEGAFDEYSSYAPAIARYALRGNTGVVADHLARLRFESMGLRPNPTADHLIADRLVAIAAEFSFKS